MMADTMKVKRNIRRMIDQGASEAEIDQYVAGEGTTPEELRASSQTRQFEGSSFERFRQMHEAGLFGQPPGTLDDIGHQFRKGLVQGAAGLVAFPAQVGTWLGDKATQGIDYMVGREHQPLPPDSSMLNPANLPRTVEERMGIGPARTTMGSYANTMGQFIPGAVMGPSSITHKAMGAAASGASSEAAGRSVRGTRFAEYEPYVRVAGAVAGGFAPDLARKAVTPLPISPERARMVETLGNEGVDLTAGQVSGRKSLQYMESEMGGGRTAQMIERQGEQFTEAALRRAGINAPRATPEVIDQAFTRIGRKFDGLAARNNLVADPVLAREIATGVQEYASLVPPSARAPIVHNLARDVISTAQQGMTGAQYQAFRSRIGTMARKATDPQLRDVLTGLQTSLDDAMERTLAATGSPDLGAWREARTQYRNMLVIEKAAAGAGENTALGILSPSQIRSATVQKQGPRNYVRGQGDYAELSRAGEALMKPLPNSGTAPRMAARAMSTSLPTVVGGMLGNTVGMPVGGMLAGAVVGTGLPHAMARALMSKPVQAYLKNQSAATMSRLSPAQRAMITALGSGTSISNARDQ